jgi:hypothetical protein
MLFLLQKPKVIDLIEVESIVVVTRVWEGLK